jgi:hypothetical protein
MRTNEPTQAAHKAELGAAIFERHGLVEIPDSLVDLAVASTRLLVDCCGDANKTLHHEAFPAATPAGFAPALLALSRLDDADFSEAVRRAESGSTLDGIPPEVMIVAAVCIDCARSELEPGFEPRVSALSVLHSVLHQDTDPTPTVYPGR